MQPAIISNQILSSEDLALLQTFLEAWCAENGVGITDDAARDVATGLIHWYMDGLSDKSRFKDMIGDTRALPPALQELLERLEFIP
ncbi:MULTISPECIES: hypothetical protein [unclassified Rhizobium]|uniref:hypothetical protein n=1 Tax=unclassified Rhizobium TaxID=2613769 RepID=UPI00071341FA|nr:MULTISPECIES: hypothetical protein [unclassified Rhizobium]KQS82401.1 hypothetical protein ASG50_13400 [Rhizobium sp. Leaf386]KQT02748.1 hypothetical protein ASG42_26375 [Rhizobium sp. Leaf391]KQU03467.1 hypothetical protein ASG68_27780 [Rhizobium sp. Leaf453]